MPLPIPNLDDRRFQDLVDEAKRLIPRYCPEWTDHNVSDPGVTLIELFAWMVEIMIYRLNRVPEKSYITFMELMGVRLEPASAASTELTFWLSAATVETLKIPAGTEVSTRQTAAERTITFRTDSDLLIIPPHMIACLTSPDETEFTDQTRKLAKDAFLAFSADPQPGHAFYIGYAQELSSNILSLLIDCAIEGIGVNPTNPPLAWEAWQHDGWVELETERDETRGLNTDGRVNLYLSPRMTRRKLGEHECYWVRCRYTPPEPGQDRYTASPRISSIDSSTIGGMVPAVHATVIVGEILGRSNGRPGQNFRLEHAPVLDRRPDERVEVLSEENEWEPWTECATDHFGNSGKDDLHVLVDSVSGEVSFGPAIREPDGSERQYGAIPRRGALIRFNQYRCGGGAAGNVGRGMLVVLKSAVPYVDRVTNRQPALGGRDPESLEHAKLRAPQMLRSFRAVTAEDYEYLATESSPNIVRSHCLQAGAIVEGGGTSNVPPGEVRVSLVPMVAQPEGRIQPEQLRLSQDVVRQVQAYLDERRLLTTVVRIGQPEYLWVSVAVKLRARLEANREMVKQEVLATLYRYLNPVVGGAAGTGWPFGRDLYISEIYTILQPMPGIAYIEQVSLKLLGSEETRSSIEVPPNGLIVSADHEVHVMWGNLMGAPL